MKLKISKRTLTIFIALFVVSVLGGIYWFSRGVGPYDEFAKYCSQGRFSPEIVCKAFILGATEGADETFCFDLLVYRGEGERMKEVELCEQEAPINWENPYADYSKVIPVDMVLHLEKGIFSYYSLVQVDFELMPDEDSLAILNIYPDSFEVRIAAQEEINRKGYFFSSPEDSNEKDRLRILNAVVHDIVQEEGELLLYLGLDINEQELRVKARVQEIYYVGDVEITEEEQMLFPEVFNAGNYELFDSGGFFSLFFLFDPEEANLEVYSETLNTGSESQEYIDFSEGLKTILFEET